MNLLHIPGKPIRPPDAIPVLKDWDAWRRMVTSDVERMYVGATITWDKDGNPTLFEHYKDDVYKGKSRAKRIMEYVIEVSMNYGVLTVFFIDEAETVE